MECYFVFHSHFVEKWEPDLATIFQIQLFPSTTIGGHLGVSINAISAHRTLNEDFDGDYEMIKTGSKDDFVHVFDLDSSGELRN